MEDAQYQHCTNVFTGRVVQSVKQLTTDWTVRDQIGMNEYSSTTG